MSYAVALTPRFATALEALPTATAEQVLDEIDRLARQPVALSRRADMAAGQYQVYDFVGIIDGSPHRFQIRFQYGQDEETLHLATLVVVPSERTGTFREPWGLVVNEAMHAKRLVVGSTEVGAVAGGLLEDARTGLVFDAGRPAALADAVRRGLAYAELRARLAAAGHRRASAYTWDAWAAAVARALGGSLA